jgi:alanyl-tRNA synthetase
MIKLSRRERVRSSIRVEFWAGLRALARFRRLSKITARLGELTSSGPGELIAWVEAAQSESRRLRGELKALHADLAASEARSLVEAAEVTAAGRVVRAVYEDRDPKLVREIALGACRDRGTIALLGTSFEGSARLVFARAADVSLDMDVPLRAALAVLGGKGGGRPDLVQSGSGDPTKLEAALAEARRTVEGE